MPQSSDEPIPPSLFTGDPPATEAAPKGKRERKKAGAPANLEHLPPNLGKPLKVTLKAPPLAEAREEARRVLIDARDGKLAPARAREAAAVVLTFDRLADRTD